ncbi:hypothetical protein HPB48_008992 [Haemaphysalis longicornis]|uniref:Uncharacterized protein n=1 Tax=Haemaphysalis longicornis TaxID=44386 RepID=A0A9J6H469_HAELO|nr:hypothetical protein HPB48_008992 [Haemaphysalis longicornis]
MLLTPNELLITGEDCKKTAFNSCQYGAGTGSGDNEMNEQAILGLSSHLKGVRNGVMNRERKKGNVDEYEKRRERWHNRDEEGAGNVGRGANRKRGQTDEVRACELGALAGLPLIKAVISLGRRAVVLNFHESEPEQKGFVERRPRGLKRGKMECTAQGLRQGRESQVQVDIGLVASNALGRELSSALKTGVCRGDLGLPSAFPQGGGMAEEDRSITANRSERPYFSGVPPGTVTSSLVTRGFLVFIFLQVLPSISRWIGQPGTLSGEKSGWKRKKVGGGDLRKSGKNEVATCGEDMQMRGTL